MTARERNRSLLARQMLLERQPADPLAALQRTGCLQAQLARPPYIALWSRLQSFERAALTNLLHSRQIIKATLMRGTLHLAAAADYLRWRHSFSDALAAAVEAIGKERLVGLDRNAVCLAATRLFHERPRRFEELRQALLTEFPDANDRMLGYTARMQLPLAVVPDSPVWGFAADGEFALAEQWLGAKIEKRDNKEDLVIHYLTAFGPATPADAQQWLGLGGLRPAFEKLRGTLTVDRDERKRELFDVAGAPRPDGGVPAPVRFLGEFDNLLLAHADREHVVPDAAKPLLATKNLMVPAAFLVDGMVAGTWKATATKRSATLTMRPAIKLSKKVKEELSAEGGRLLDFLEPGAGKQQFLFAME